MSVPAGMTSRSPGKRADNRSRRSGSRARPGTCAPAGSGEGAQSAAMKASRAAGTGRSWLPVCTWAGDSEVMGLLRGSVADAVAVGGCSSVPASAALPGRRAARMTGTRFGNGMTHTLAVQFHITMLRVTPHGCGRDFRPLRLAFPPAVALPGRSAARSTGPLRAASFRSTLFPLLPSARSRFRRVPFPGRVPFPLRGVHPCPVAPGCCPHPSAPRSPWPCWGPAPRREVTTATRTSDSPGWRPAPSSAARRSGAAP